MKPRVPHYATNHYVTPTGSRFRRLRGGKTRDGLVSGVSSEKEEKEEFSMPLIINRLRPVPLRDDNNNCCGLVRCRRRRLRGAMGWSCDEGEAGSIGRFRLVLEAGGVAREALVPSSSSSSSSSSVDDVEGSSSVCPGAAIPWWPLRQQAAAFEHAPQRVRRCRRQHCTLRPSSGLWCTWQHWSTVRL